AEIIIEGRCELRLRIDLRRRYSAYRGRGGEMMVLDIVEHEVLVERRRKLVVKRVAGRGFESRLFRLPCGFTGWRGSKPMILVSSANGSSSAMSLRSATFSWVLSAIIVPELAHSRTPWTSRRVGPYQRNVGKR
ncbi:hypothetical protein, partial [Mesorhizobium sp.]|uniref:hypothetical protein n=1 Tax=Mesorhizobium sp. TaxID=1871066 RepID=UPI0025E6F9A5